MPILRLPSIIHNYSYLPFISQAKANGISDYFYLKSLINHSLSIVYFIRDG